jgi:hypothetical protein
MEFEQGCLRVDFPNQTSSSLRYDESVPIRAVHLYRNPFDNLVARMHLAIHRRERQGKNVSSFENSRDGWREWCIYLDEKYHAEEPQYFSTEVLASFRDLPCHADWYRYVQWHNHAHELAKRRQLPVLDLFYEDYTLAYESTVHKLMEFLQIAPRKPPLDFFVGKSYEVFFDQEHARIAARFVREFSSPEVWTRLERYFVPYIQ